MSDRPVLSLVGRTWREECRADARKLLQEWLARVEAGEISSIAIAGIDDVGNALHANSSMDHKPALVGAVAFLLARLTTPKD